MAPAREAERSAASTFAFDEIDGEHHRITFGLDLPDEAVGDAVFGGMILGCAAHAAGLSCPDRPLASLHVHFLRPVPERVPVDFVAQPLRDGRRIAHRRVEVRADGKLRAELRAAFARVDPAGPALAGRREMRGVPAPETLKSEVEVAREEGWGDDPYTPPIEWRWVGRPWVALPGEPSSYQGWVRPVERIGESPGLQAAMIAFLSDFHVHWPVARLGGVDFSPAGYSSLDSAIWIHRDGAWDDWWMIESECDVGFGGRAFTRRRLYRRSGELVASMAQEALLPGT